MREVNSLQKPTILPLLMCRHLRALPSGKHPFKKGYTIAENSTVILNGDSEYIAGCADCAEYTSGETWQHVVGVFRS